MQRSATHAPVAIERAARRRTSCRSPKEAARLLRNKGLRRSCRQGRGVPKFETRTFDDGLAFLVTDRLLKPVPPSPPALPGTPQDRGLRNLGEASSGPPGELRGGPAELVGVPGARVGRHR
eukprot:6901086-Pyramimonas_sp.AAC.1